MGVVGTLKRISPETLATLQGDVDATQIFVLMQARARTLHPGWPDLGPALRDQLEERDRNRMGLWLMREEPERYRRLEAHVPAWERQRLDPALGLDKSWHVLHYVLCRHADVGDALSWPVLGRGEVAAGLDDPPVKYLDPEAAFEAAAALNVAKFDILDELTRGDRAPKVYRWYEGYKSDLLPIFEALRTYYAFAAENGMAMLSWRV